MSHTPATAVGALVAAAEALRLRLLPPDSKRAFGYLRISKEERLSGGVSLAAQRDAIAAYCTARGLEIVGWYVDDGVSGKIPLTDRPHGSLLCADLQAGDHVVFAKQDRGFRNTRDALEMLDWFDIRRINSHVLGMGGVGMDTSTAQGRFVYTIFAAIAENEREQIRTRTKDALGALRRRGLRWNSYAPHGYRWDKIQGQTKPGRHGGPPRPAYQLAADPKLMAELMELDRLRRAGLTFWQIYLKWRDDGRIRKLTGRPWAMKALWKAHKRWLQYEDYGQKNEGGTA